MTKNLDLTSLPSDALAALRAEAAAAIDAYEAIDDWFSPEGRAACRKMILACAAANAELARLATDPKTRHGSWRTPFDVEMMLLGFL